MKSMKTKSKTRKTNGRVKFSSRDRIGSIGSDLSSLHPPIDTSVSTLLHVTQLLENGSEELKSILTYECDLLYECRVCRSLFRSLANFVSHKRIYCVEKFDVTFVRNTLNDFDTNIIRECARKTEKTVQENSNSNRILRSQVSREERKRDLTAVVNMLQKKQSQNSSSDTRQIFLENIKSNSSAVYQTAATETGNIDLMKIQVTEIENMLGKQVMLLGPDGQLLERTEIEKNDSPIQLSGSDDENDEFPSDTSTQRNLVCSICGAKFSTKKTLATHAKMFHTSRRMSYSCPYCPRTFTTTWSVYRHLFKVHRKSNDQVRKLRSQIQEKAVCKDTTVAEDLEKERTAKLQERNSPLYDDTQAWIDHLESDSDLQRCGGCGKRFDRKAALSSHSQYCQRRIAAYNEVTSRAKETKRLLSLLNNNESSARNSGSSGNNGNSGNGGSLEKNLALDPLSSFASDLNELSIRVEAVASLSKEDWDKLDDEMLLSTPVKDSVTIAPGVNTSNSVETREEAAELPEIICTSVRKPEDVQAIRGSKKRKMRIKRANVKPHAYNSENERKAVTEEDKTSRSIVQGSSRVDHAQLMERKVASITNLQKLQCLPCKRKFTSVTNLRRHVAIHIGWNRYRCKLCEFKCFVKCDCVAHCNKMHNAQNDRTVIADMMEQIPDQEYAYDRDIVIDISEMERNVCASEITEIPSSKRPSPESESDSKCEDEPEKEIRRENETQDNANTTKENNESRPLTNQLESLPVQKEVFCLEEKVLENAESMMQPKKTSSNKSAVTNGVSSSESELQADEATTDEEESFAKVRNVINGRCKTAKLDADPALRRMVMEVIFGSANPYAQNESQTVDSLPEAKIEPEEKSSKVRRARSVVKEMNSCTEEMNSTQDPSKSTRPVRNRMKRLNKDFVYDLKEVPYRKEGSLMLKGATLSKAINKRPLLESKGESELEVEDIQRLKTFKKIRSASVPLLLPYENSIMEKVDVVG